MNLKFEMTYNVVRTHDYMIQISYSKWSFSGLPNKISLSRIKASDLIRNINNPNQIPLILNSFIALHIHEALPLSCVHDL